MGFSEFLSNRRYLLAAAGLIAGLVVFILVFQKIQGGSSLEIAKDRLQSKGPAGAPVQVIEFADFQCPACARGGEVMRGLMEKYPRKIHLVFRHYPLAGHPHSKPAHQAARCAAKQRRFWPYHDKLFGEQKKWSILEDVTEQFLMYAKDLELNLDKFAACMSDQSVTDEVFANKAEGEKMKVRSTPTFFINGERFVGGGELATKGEAFIRETLGLAAEEAPAA